jgi:tryptophan synthase beta subunit
MLSRNLSGTFTHVRAYAKTNSVEDAKVMHAFPQLSGKELLANMESAHSLVWRAEFACLEQK